MKQKQMTSRKIRIQALILSFIMVFSLLPISIMAVGNDQTANEDIIRTLQIQYKLKGQEDFIILEEPYVIEDITKIESFKAIHTFEIEDNAEVGFPPARTMNEGDFYFIDLPKGLIVSEFADGEIKNEDDKVLANYTFIEEEPDKWAVKIKFTEVVDDPNVYDVFGCVTFDFGFDLDSIGDGESETYYIPIDNTTYITIDVTKPEPPPTKPASLIKSVKSFNEATRKLSWNVKMEPEEGIFEGCVFTDNIDPANLILDSVKHGSVTLVEGVDYTYNTTTGEMVYTIPEGRNGKNYQNIEVATTVRAEVYARSDETIIKNKTHLGGGDEFVDIESNESTHKIIPDWFGKQGQLYQGNKILWTIKVNSNRQWMYNAVITDYLSSDLIFIDDSLKINGSPVEVFDSTYISSGDEDQVYAIYTEDGSGAILRIYQPKGVANATNETLTLTFITEVKEPTSVEDEASKYENRATLETEYIGDNGIGGTIPEIDITTEGTEVPYVYVVKNANSMNADDKRHGTIRWTINAASNLASYGKSTIVDTLPIDQTYIASSIYWGSIQLNETTSPSAVISGDGRILTITFDTPNALKEIQTFTVKTKIDPDIYGNNINRNFTNKVKANIYDGLGEEILDSDEDNASIRVLNTVIFKSSSNYNSNDTKQGINPKVNYSITINGNLMPLKNVVVTDDLNTILTQFRALGESSWQNVAGVKWTLVPGTLNIVNQILQPSTYILVRCCENILQKASENAIILYKLFRRCIMAVSYDKLWKLLIDRKMSKAGLRKVTNISPNTITKMNKNEHVALSILDKICNELDCDFGDIVEHIKENENT